VVDFYHYRTGISGYNENLHKTTQIKTKIKKSSLKIILTQKKMDFLLFGYRENAGTPSFFASLALGRDTPARGRRPPQTVASPPHASSLKPSVSLHLYRFLSNLSLGWDEKKRRARKKKERAGEKGREKKKFGS
jgi:hypothetical protein